MQFFFSLSYLIISRTGYIQYLSNGQNIRIKFSDPWLDFFSIWLSKYIKLHNLKKNLPSQVNKVIMNNIYILEVCKRNSYLFRVSHPERLATWVKAALHNCNFSLFLISTSCLAKASAKLSLWFRTSEGSTP